MKLRINSLLGSLIIVIIILVFSFPAMATNVSGIIDTDTTWTSAGNPYYVISTIQIDVGVTLTIMPGVVVNGADQVLEVFGTLNAIGAESSKISFYDLKIKTNVNGVVNMAFAEFSAGYMGIGGYGGILNLSDSTIRDLTFIGLQGIEGDCYIERNVFINTRGIHLDYSKSYSTYIRNNVFYQQQGSYAVNVGWGQAIVQYNSFLRTDSVALELQPNRFPPGDMVAIDNFWNTTDSNIIDSMIYDWNDDRSIANVIEYLPILEAPHEDTPILDLNQAPTSNSGDDQVVHDQVTLNGTGSSDPEGSIVSYDWSLQHRTNSANNRTAIGDNPTVSNLNPGFYDVYLTVTDDGGLVGVDNMLLAAAGSCFCTPSTFHIEMIEPDLLKADKGERFGQALVKVMDDCGNAVSEVTVYGIFSDGFSESINGETGGDGNVLLTTTTFTKGKPTFTFCVEDVTNGTLSYAPAENVETCDIYE